MLQTELADHNIVGQKIHIIFRSRPSTNQSEKLNGTSILNSGVNNTSTNNFTNIPGTLGGFMYNNNSSNHAVSARLYSVKVYNRALTDAELLVILLAQLQSLVAHPLQQHL